VCYVLRTDSREVSDEEGKSIDYGSEDTTWRKGVVVCKPYLFDILMGAINDSAQEVADLRMSNGMI